MLGGGVKAGLEICDDLVQLVDLSGFACLEEGDALAQAVVLCTHAFVLPYVFLNLCIISGSEL